MTSIRRGGRRFGNVPRAAADKLRFTVALCYRCEEIHYLSPWIHNLIAMHFNAFHGRERFSKLAAGGSSGASSQLHTPRAQDFHLLAIEVPPTVSSRTTDVKAYEGAPQPKTELAQSPLTRFNSVLHKRSPFKKKALTERQCDCMPVWVPALRARCPPIAMLLTNLPSTRIFFGHFAEGLNTDR
ncbi:hypothetical protein LMG28614_06963 [Paraburkholderia ultramafica]|uniref:Uncharacterized protein n=1 Tax=Paraburkholderia ultramafica TaxID=1544867 RepID=A0A6S7C3J6_9BURK|nr:hypothetical protein LMG28614_06963 [Paraburkholderia ultramafica]